MHVAVFKALWILVVAAAAVSIGLAAAPLFSPAYSGSDCVRRADQGRGRSDAYRTLALNSANELLRDRYEIYGAKNRVTEVWFGALSQVMRF
jgi:hypothetical protein